jgi:hypothetical protein
MLRIEFTSNIVIENSTFSGNFLFETEFNRRQRAAVIYVSSFNGSFTINNTQIGNHSGMFEKQMRDIFFAPIATFLPSTASVNQTNSTNASASGNRTNSSQGLNNTIANSNVSVNLTGITSFNQQQLFLSNSGKIAFYHSFL